MREKIDAFRHAPEILSMLSKGVLLTTAAEGEVNSMTIGWGALGIEWRKPVFICYVRLGRHTHAILEQNPEFTVNVPLADLDADRAACVRRILAGCGTKSGRDMDKATAFGLTLADGEQVAVPAVGELPLTLECRVIYQRDQDISLLPDPVREACYPQGVPTSAAGANEDAHTEYYGEILDAYILRRSR